MNNPAKMRRPQTARSIQEALALHRQGRLEEAGRIYNSVLAADPNHFDALHLGGVLRHQQGRSAEALRLVGAALKAQPGSADALANYGVILDALERHEEALAAFEKLLAVRGEGRNRPLQSRQCAEETRPLCRGAGKLRGGACTGAGQCRRALQSR